MNELDKSELGTESVGSEVENQEACYLAKLIAKEGTINAC